MNGIAGPRYGALFLLVALTMAACSGGGGSNVPSGGSTATPTTSPPPSTASPTSTPVSVPTASASPTAMPTASPTATPAGLQALNPKGGTLNFSTGGVSGAVSYTSFTAGGTVYATIAAGTTTPAVFPSFTSIKGATGPAVIAITTGFASSLASDSVTFSGPAPPPSTVTASVLVPGKNYLVQLLVVLSPGALATPLGAPVPATASVTNTLTVSSPLSSGTVPLTNTLQYLYLGIYPTT